MELDISDKIAIIRRYKLSPAELSLLLNLNPDQETLLELARGNHTFLIEWIDKSIDNPSLNDESRLYFAHFANIFEKQIGEEVLRNVAETQIEKMSNMVEDYAQDIIAYDDTEPQTVDEKKKYKEFKKHKKDIQSWSQDEITNKLITFVESEMPYIFDSGIKGKKQEVNKAFNASIKLYDYFWELNDKTRSYLCNAQAFLVMESEKRRTEYERKMIPKWTEEFKNWCRHLGITKYTKSNIKEFFKESGLKVLPTTIDLLKYNL